MMRTDLNESMRTQFNLPINNNLDGTHQYAGDS